MEHWGFSSGGRMVDAARLAGSRQPHKRSGMSVDSCQRDVQRHQNEIARLQQEKSREASKAAQEAKRANAAAELAARTASASMMRSRLQAAQAHQTAAIRHQQKVAEIESRIAREHSRLVDAQRWLAAAEDQEARRRTQSRTRAERNHGTRMQAITGKLAQHDHLHRATLSAIERLEQLPQEITVLFLAANPLDEAQLRLDEEARMISEMIRKSEYRDAVRFESRWAVRPLDVLQAINECQPRVVHFSGHGSDQDHIVFQGNAGRAKYVSKESIVQTLAAASSEIKLVFFNACYSRAQAEAVVQHIPAAIGMNTSIGDEAARLFSAHFYSAIGFGLSIDRAFRQAKAALMLEGVPEETTPHLFMAPGLAMDDLVLVRPGWDAVA